MQTFSTYNSSHVSITFKPNGLTSGQRWRLDEFSFHLSNAAKPNGTVATAANTLTITRKSQLHGNCNIIVKAIPMLGESDVYWKPERLPNLRGKDSLQIVWTNDASSFKNWGIQIDYEV